MKAIRFFWQEKSVHHVTFEQRLLLTRCRPRRRIILPATKPMSLSPLSATWASVNQLIYGGNARQWTMLRQRTHRLALEGSPLLAKSLKNARIVKLCGCSIFCAGKDR
jgi:hypothetical protein